MTREMGLNGHFGWQQSLAADVRFVPKADIDALDKEHEGSLSARLSWAGDSVS